jgi:CDP-paratose 2-epimerase
LNAVFSYGFDETTPIDGVMHSVFGASKVAADIMVQEYGRYFGMPTACFRGGCLTGAAHAGAEQHGFLAYLMKCAREGRPYRIYGHKGKQVRDNIHAYDLADAFWCFVQRPSKGAVYNIGGGPDRSVSVIEAIAKAEAVTGRTMDVEYVDEARKGDHIWWVTDVSKFRRDYPEWEYRWSLDQIFEEMASPSLHQSPAVVTPPDGALSAAVEQPDDDRGDADDGTDAG